MPDLQTLARWIRKSATRSPTETARKAGVRSRDFIERERGRRHDLRSATYALDSGGPPIRPRLTPIEAGAVGKSADDLLTTSTHNLRHEFNLLGSGWVGVAEGMRCEGFEGHRFDAAPPFDPDGPSHSLGARVSQRNRAESLRIRALLEPDYVPIDWQLDFRSGFRWDEATWFRDISYGNAPGIDVKVPWELARLQHLPRLALAAALARDRNNGFEAAERYVSEIRNELLDFIASNPPRFGVNWATTMDVAIRAVNMLVAYDLVRAYGWRFDSEADAVIRRSVLEHGRHIAANPEWDPYLRGNHYLADVAALAILGSYVEAPEAGGWLERGATELGRELDLQFHEDGTNFEGSTSYHRLSAETAVYAVAAIMGAPGGRVRLPGNVGDLLRRMAQFTAAVTGPGGFVAQVGDNDSGRFLQLVPVAPEHSLDHRHLADAMAGLLGDAVADGIPPGPDRSALRALAGGANLAPTQAAARTAPAQALRIAGTKALDEVMERIAGLPGASRATYRIAAPGTSLTSRLTLSAFPYGGYWVARSDRFHLVIRCGPVGQDGNGGHDHNDQLSFSIWLDGEPLIQDPGTYVYLPLLEERNRYRSAANHSGPLPDGPEPARLDIDPFSLGDPRPGICLAWCEEGFAGRHVDRLGREALEVIRWDGGEITIEHGMVGGSLAPARRAPASWETLKPSVPFSPGYGVRGN
jgi:Heparinase II/III-like protein/Heparinase II/III N-terminus